MKKALAELLGRTEANWGTLVVAAASGLRTADAVLVARTAEGAWRVLASLGAPPNLADAGASLERVVDEGTATRLSLALRGASTTWAVSPVSVDGTRCLCLLVPSEGEEGPRPGALAPYVAVVTAFFEEQVRAAEARAEFVAVRRQLERADRLAMVGKLGAGIAHELGTPIAVVAGRARQMASGAVPMDQLAQAARTIIEQTDRMVNIIRQLLDFARRRGPRLGRFDSRTLLRQALALLEPVAARKNVKLALEELKEPQVAQFDGSQMLQVLSNLVMNAVQATPVGGQVSLQLGRAHAVPPPETGLEAGQFVQLRVVDFGVGIPEENVSRVFEPFFTTKDTGEGTGLGLSVAQGIVRDHDGWISVESRLGQGSTFTVHLPC